MMALSERVDRVGSWVNIQQDCQETYQVSDENKPLSPGEVQKMRNQSKVSTKLHSSSRKSSKSMSFTVHGSPSCASKLGKSLDGSSTDKRPNERRKTLQVLQPAADGNGVLVGSGGAARRQQKKQVHKLKVKDNHTQRTLKDCNSTTSTESSDSDSTLTNSKYADNTTDDAYELMVKEPAPEKYWQMIAEERRVALHEALEENQKLYKELEALRERCNRLEEVANQAEYFASLYAMVMEGEAPNLDDSDSTNFDNTCNSDGDLSSDIVNKET